MVVVGGAKAADIAFWLEAIRRSKKRRERLAGEAKGQEGATLEDLAYRKRQYSNVIEIVTT